MTTSTYQTILAELTRDLADSEAEELELRRLERYLLRKLEGDVAAVEPAGNGAPTSLDRESRLDLLDAVRQDLAGIERVLDELRILDTRVRRLSVRPSANGRSTADDVPVEPASADASASVDASLPVASSGQAGSGAAEVKHGSVPAPSPHGELCEQLTTIRITPGDLPASAAHAPPAPEPTPEPVRSDERGGPAESAACGEHRPGSQVVSEQPAQTPSASVPAPFPSQHLTRELLGKAAGIRIVSRGDFAPAAPVRGEAVDVVLFTTPAVVSGQTASLFLLCRGAESETAPAVEPPNRGQPAGAAGSLGTVVGCDARLVFNLAIAGIPVRMPRREIVWTGDSTVAEYRIAIPAAIRAGSVIGKLTIVQNTVPIGRITFQWRLLHEPRAASGDIEPAGQAHRFKRAYLCFAPKDRHQVQRRVPLLRSAGIQPVDGNLELDASQRWARGLYRQIDQCDVLFVFWSPAAADSAWIQKEWQYALKRQGADVVLPVILDGELSPQLSALNAVGAEPYLHVARSG
jgi:hypothetical protein